jgi:hypothetical protein
MYNLKISAKDTKQFGSFEVSRFYFRGSEKTYTLDKDLIAKFIMIEYVVGLA